MVKEGRWKNQSITQGRCKGIFALTLFLFLGTLQVKAQLWPFELWHDGKVVLMEGDTLNGKIKYDINQDIIQFQSHTTTGTVGALSSRKVLFYEIFDLTVKKYRQFFALPYTTAGNYRTPVFFELLEDGKLTLLTREALEYRNYSNGFYGGTYSRMVLINKYYFMDQNGMISEFKGNRSDLLDLMGKKSEQVDDYIKSNRLKLEFKEDFSKIVAYYNSLN